MKIALVKQEVYDDYWVCDPYASVEEKIFTSMMRVGQASFFIEYGADAFIVKVDKAPECQVWRQKTKEQGRWTPASDYELLSKKILSEIPGQDHKRPGSKEPTGKYAIDCRSVDWGVYDIVICHDIPIPSEVTKKYPKTLWCYMIQEPFMPAFKGHVIEGYDVRLNQLLGLKTQLECGEVDFPAAFLGGCSLTIFMRNVLGRQPKNKGVFPEINMCEGRPVKTIPHEKELERFGINMHKQDIKENLIQLYDSKYFIKLGGRTIRGNAVVEAISSSCLVLMDQGKTFYRMLLTPETHVDSIEVLTDKLDYFERNPGEYAVQLAKQKMLVQKHAHDIPLFTLISLADQKKGQHEKA